VAKTAGPRLRKLRPRGLDSLTDRQAEIVEQLAAIADLAGEPWESQFRRDVTELFGYLDDDNDASTMGTLLLRHVRDAFRAAGTDHLFTETLLTNLNGRDEAFWGRMGPEGFGMTARELARKLKPYGIRSQTVGDGSARGYKRSQFEDAWERYCPLPHQELALLNGRKGPSSRQDGTGQLDVLTDTDGSEDGQAATGRRLKIKVRRRDGDNRRAS
jgi:hypothetical protein